MHLVIIGGGITGLSAAWEAQQRGISYTLLEASERWGGKIISTELQSNGARFLVEGGPDTIVTRKHVNLGIAVELADGKGLIVPVVKNAETLNLLGMAKAIAGLAERARNKQLLPDDVQGGTFTITNPGGYGTFHGTPVISQPQAAILGTYAVVKRPWVVQDELGQDVIAIRPIMNVTLTYDHRLVDGAYAGRFLKDLKQRLETWEESAY